MDYVFNETSKKSINTFLNLLKDDLYGTSATLEIGDVMFGTPAARCQCYIVRFNYNGMIFYNGYRDFDVMHICAKNDNSGHIDCIKIFPDKNSKTSILLDKVKQTGNLFGINICKVENNEEWDGSTTSRVIRLYVNKSIVKRNIKAVDLGLSVMWGDRNLGAEATEMSGDYYSWTDATTLKNGLDIAGQILGKGWRLPTYREIEELCSNPFNPSYSRCGFGLEVHGKNGNSIFLPTTDIESPYVVSKLGLYWSSTLDTETPGCACQLRFDRIGAYGGCNKIDRKQLIRPVFDPYI